MTDTNPANQPEPGANAPQGPTGPVRPTNDAPEERSYAGRTFAYVAVGVAALALAATLVCQGYDYLKSKYNTQSPVVILSHSDSLDAGLIEPNNKLDSLHLGLLVAVPPSAVKKPSSSKAEKSYTGADSTAGDKPYNGATQGTSGLPNDLGYNIVVTGNHSVGFTGNGNIVYNNGLPVKPLDSTSVEPDSTKIDSLTTE